MKRTNTIDPSKGNKANRKTEHDAIKKFVKGAEIMNTRKATTAKVPENKANTATKKGENIVKTKAGKAVKVMAPKVAEKSKAKKPEAESLPKPNRQMLKIRDIITAIEGVECIIHVRDAENKLLYYGDAFAKDAEKYADADVRFLKLYDYNDGLNWKFILA